MCAASVKIEITTIQEAIKKGIIRLRLKSIVGSVINIRFIKKVRLSFSKGASVKW